MKSYSLLIICLVLFSFLLPIYSFSSRYDDWDDMYVEEAMENDRTPVGKLEASPWNFLYWGICTFTLYLSSISKIDLVRQIGVILSFAGMMFFMMRSFAYLVLMF